MGATSDLRLASWLMRGRPAYENLGPRRLLDTQAKGTR